MLGVQRRGGVVSLLTTQNVIVNAPVKYILAALNRLATVLPAGLFLIQQASLTDEGSVVSCVGFSLLTTFMPFQVF